jgi:hypothetical protein
MAREFTTRMHELLDEGMFNKDMLIYDLLEYLTEDEVKDFVRRNDYYGFKDLGFTSSDDEELSMESDAYGDNATEFDFV